MACGAVYACIVLKCTTSEGAGLVTINDSTGNEVVHFTVRGPGGSFCTRRGNGNANCLLPLP